MGSLEVSTGAAVRRHVRASGNYVQSYELRRRCGVSTTQSPTREVSQPPYWFQLNLVNAYLPYPAYAGGVLSRFGEGVGGPTIAVRTNLT